MFRQERERANQTSDPVTIQKTETSRRTAAEATATQNNVSWGRCLCAGGWQSQAGGLTLGFHHERDRAVVHQFHFHHGAEAAGPYLVRGVGQPGLGHKLVPSLAGRARRHGPVEIRLVALVQAAVESELRHQQDLRESDQRASTMVVTTSFSSSFGGRIKCIVVAATRTAATLAT